MSDSVGSRPFAGVTMTTPGLGGWALFGGDSNPESILLSEEVLLNDRVSGKSMDALYVHGLWVMGTVCVCRCDCVCACVTVCVCMCDCGCMCVCALGS